MNIPVHFKLDRETKGALRYQEISADGKELKSDMDGSLIGTVYLRKARLGGAIPQTLTITVDDGEGTAATGTPTKARNVRVVKSA